MPAKKEPIKRKPVKAKAKSAKRKPVKKKPARRKPPVKAKAKPVKAKQKQAKPIGIVTHYFGNINVGIIKLKDVLRVGEKIHIKGHTSDFKQTIASMQIEHEAVKSAKKGSVIGIKVKEHVREHDLVYKVAP